MHERGRDESTSAKNPLIARAVELHRARRHLDAADAYDVVADDLEQKGRDARCTRMLAMHTRIVGLHAETRSREVVEVCDELLGRYGDDEGPEAVKILADTMWLESRALGRAGDRDRERTVLHQLIDRYDDRSEARSQVARARYNLGVYLEGEGRSEDAVKMWDQLHQRPRDGLSKDAAFVPIRGQLAKCGVIAKTQGFGEAREICDELLTECERLGLSNAEVLRNHVAFAANAKAGKLRRGLKRGFTAATGRLRPDE